MNTVIYLWITCVYGLGDPICMKTDITYSQHARPILEKNCAGCHNNNNPGLNWLKYEDAFRKRDRIKVRVQNRSMPPGFPVMTEEERATLIEWVDQGGKK